MTIKQKADLVAVTHLAWLILGLASLAPVITFDSYKFVVWGYLILTFISWLIWGGCVLRVWEKNLREKVNPNESYGGSFIGYHLRKNFGITVSEKTIRIGFLLFMAIILVFSFL